MKNIFYVQHKIRYEQNFSRKGIGVYSTHALAVDVIARLRNKPGFIDPRGAFSIYCCEVDIDYWPDGLDASQRSSMLVSVRDQAEVASSGDQLFLAYCENENVDDDFILIGYYSTRTLAEQAASRTNMLVPTRKRYVCDVSISTVNRDNWVDGFGPAD